MQDCKPLIDKFLPEFLLGLQSINNLVAGFNRFKQCFAVCRFIELTSSSFLRRLSRKLNKDSMHISDRVHQANSAKDWGERE